MGRSTRGWPGTGHRAGVGAVVGALAVALFASAPAVQGQAPSSLAETGLYADAATKTLAPGVLPFSPQYPLWSDGATKRRWIRLPEGTAIDASDPDAWVFPIGTRVWKQFSFERPIETRYMELQPDGRWLYATYRWNEEGNAAALAPERGVKRVTESRPGVPYGLPAVADCRACHDSGASAVLGFSALQLSSDRDPAAPHATAPEAGSVDLAELVRRGLLVGLPPALAAGTLRVRAATPTARTALGYLHGNCSHCHNPRSPIANLGLFLDVRADGTPDALASAVGQPSHYRPTGTGIEVRVVPGHPAESLLIARVSSRNPVRQMPPMATRVVDEEALALLTRWIADDLPASAPASGSAPIHSPAPSSGTSQEEAP